MNSVFREPSALMQPARALKRSLLSTLATFSRVGLIALCVCLLSISSFAAATEAPRGNDEPVRFNRDIRPLLAENCFHCHGADSVARKAKLRLDREDGLFAKDKDGAIVEKGKPEASLLYARIMSGDDDEIMPPPDSNKKLSSEEKALFKRWIQKARNGRRTGRSSNRKSPRCPR